MDIKPESEILSEEEINLYDYWKILVRKKKILIGIFLIPIVIVTIVSLSLPRYYRGESEISIPALPASNIPSVITATNIVRLMGNIDGSQKVKIFTNNAVAIESVLISLPKKSTDKVNITIETKRSDIIPQAFKDIFDYINNLSEIKEDIARIQAETDLKAERLLEETNFRIKKLIEAKEANLIYLKDLSAMIKGKKVFINLNLADLIMKDADLSIEIMNFQLAKTDAMKKKELNIKLNAGILSPPSITEQPSDSQIKQRIMITGILSLFAAIVVVFFIEYIDRMKARENN